eukprot:3330911-Amphidinium_carterae.1
MRSIIDNLCMEELHAIQMQPDVQDWSCWLWSEWNAAVGSHLVAFRMEMNPLLQGQAVNEFDFFWRKTHDTLGRLSAAAVLDFMVGG